MSTEVVNHWEPLSDGGELIKVVTSWLEINHTNFSISDSDLKNPYGKGQGSKTWRGRGRRSWKGSSLTLLWNPRASNMLEEHCKQLVKCLWNMNHVLEPQMTPLSIPDSLPSFFGFNTTFDFN